jgi:hypothetical protein
MSDCEAHSFSQTFRYEFKNDFNVSILSCAGKLQVGQAWQRRGAELGRGEERTEVLGASLAELGRGEERILTEDTHCVSSGLCFKRSHGTGGLSYSREVAKRKATSIFRPTEPVSSHSATHRSDLR